MPGSEARRPELLTSDQVIEHLLAEPLLRRSATTCVLPAIRVGWEWRFRRADLEQWIASEKARALPHAAP